jgi:Gamma-glutamyl cyclotransferase, AIG2-like
MAHVPAIFLVHRAATAIVVAAHHFHSRSPLPAVGHGRLLPVGIRRRPAALVSLFVNGTLMRGEPLHLNLAEAHFIGAARTAPRYRLLSVRDAHPAMIPAGTAGGVAVSGELYELDLAQLERVLGQEPSGLGLGVVELESGDLTLGILWTASGLPALASDVSAFGGWREYRAAIGRHGGTSSPFS